MASLASENSRVPRPSPSPATCLRADFDAAATLLSETPGLVSKLSAEDKVMLYGLYKQALFGDVPANESPPSRLSFRQRAKFDAWMAFKGTDSQAAMRKYIAQVRAIHPSFASPSSSMSSSPTNGGAGSPGGDGNFKDVSPRGSISGPSTPARDPSVGSSRGSRYGSGGKHSSSSKLPRSISGTRLNVDGGAYTPPVSVHEGDEVHSDLASEYGHSKSWEDTPWPTGNAQHHQVIENESILGSLLFTVPLLVLYKSWEIVQYFCLWPVTFALQLFGVKLTRVPDNIPMRQRKQTAAVLFFVSALPLTFISQVYMLFLVIFPLTTLPSLTYLVWALCLDESPSNGSRQPWLRSSRWTKYFCEFFPITLHRASAPLDPTRRYVFGYHPHGIISLGAFGAFGTTQTGFPQKFPGIDLRLLTLKQNFKIPIMRELLLLCGFCACDRSSCDRLLKRGPGSAICLVVGGAAESLETDPGTYRLVLRRKGFVRVAVANGADLVPVIGMGENDVFETFKADKGSIIRTMQSRMQKLVGFTLPVFWGRGVFNLTFGFLPKRRPIHVITGEPISVEPFRARGLEGEALIDAVHAAYEAALRRLFDENKDLCAPGIMRKSNSLEVVDDD